MITIRRILATIVLAFITPVGFAFAQQSTPQPPSTPSPSASPQPAAKPADVASPKAILAAAYDVISGPSTQPRNWDRMRSLFLPGARLIENSPDKDGKYTTTVLSVEEFIAAAEPFFKQDGFYEREAASHSDRYGNIMQ